MQLKIQTEIKKRLKDKAACIGLSLKSYCKMVLIGSLRGEKSKSKFSEQDNGIEDFEFLSRVKNSRIDIELSKIIKNKITEKARSLEVTFSEYCRLVLIKSLRGERVRLK